jgi:hypothetical protein
MGKRLPFVILRDFASAELSAEQAQMIQVINQKVPSARHKIFTVFLT